MQEAGDQIIRINPHALFASTFSFLKISFAAESTSPMAFEDRLL